MRRTLGRSAFWLGLLIWLAGATGVPALADLLVTVDVTGDTVIGGVDGSHLFSSNTSISSDPGAFPYDATFTFDLSKINTVGGISTAGGGYTGSLMNATFTAFGQSYSLSDPGTLNFLDIPGDNGYLQTVSNGVAGPGAADLNVFAAPAAGNPITSGGAPQSFSFAATPYAGGGSFLTFAEGDTSLIANIGNITYSRPGCSALVSGGVTKTLSGTSKTGQPYIIEGTFLPNSGFSLTQTANDCGYTSFDWASEFTSFPSDVTANDCADYSCSSVISKTAKDTPFNDPPLYGWDYCNPSSTNYRSDAKDCSNVFPFYYNPTTLSTDCAETLIFTSFCTEHVELAAS